MSAMKWSLLVPLLIILSCNLVLSADHPQYSAFSVPEDFAINGSITVNDTVVNKQAWYSIDGADWQPLALQGNEYGTSDDWLAGTATVNLPASLAGPGEHYLIVYSCSHADGWDCHGNKWQLHVFNNSGLPDNVSLVNGSCSDTCIGLGYDCGIHTICGDNVSCGSCQVGQFCDEIGQCVLSGSCGNGVCDSGENCSSCLVDCGCSDGEYCFEEGGVCLLNVSGNTYFVAVDGNDSWSGNFTHPWATFHYAVTQAYAGDTVYFRGGTYYHTSRVVLPRSGEADNPISFINYPGEKPIFDCSNYPESTTPKESIFGIYGIYKSYLVFKGLTVQNVTKIHLDDGRAHGFYIQNSHDIIFDQCVVNRSAGRCFQAHNSYSIYYYNCDAIWCADPQLADPGNAGTGFLASGYVNKSSTDTIYYYGCRAWSCADQGFGAVFEGLVIWDNCWSFNNGLHEYGYTFGCQCGFKIGYMYEDIDPIARIVKNCIAAYNPNYGFSENTNYKINLLVYNTTSYKNGNWGFLTTKYNDYKENKNIYRSNIAYDNGLWDMGIKESADHSYNSWDEPYNTPKLNNYFTSPASVNDDDFISLDWTEMLRPRKEDGSLPDINFLRLAPDSDLIDAVINVSVPFPLDGVNYSAYLE